MDRCINDSLANFMYFWCFSRDDTTGQKTIYLIILIISKLVAYENRYNWNNKIVWTSAGWRNVLYFRYRCLVSGVVCNFDKFLCTCALQELAYKLYYAVLFGYLLRMCVWLFYMYIFIVQHKAGRRVGFQKNSTKFQRFRCVTADGKM